MTENEKIVDGVRTGDLLLFSGNGWASRVIQAFTLSRWSHIGMVIYLPDTSEPLLLEASTFNASADIALGKPVRGVGLVPLADRIRSYPGEVALRRRQGQDLSGQQRRLLIRLMQRLLHRPYKNYVLCHALDLITGYSRRPDQRGWFCSELVAELYRRLGWLPEGIRPSTFVPGHFASLDLPLQGSALAPVQMLKTIHRPRASVSRGRSSLAMLRRIAGHERLLQPQ